MRQSDQNVQANIEVALCCGQYNCVYGLEYEFDLLYKNPQGRIWGILQDEGGARIRNATDAVTVYDYTSNSWVLLETLPTGIHGEFIATPLRELEGPYRIGDDGPSVYVVNREYSWAWLASALANGGQAVTMFRHPAGNVPCVIWIDGTTIKFRMLDSGYTNWGPAYTIDTSGDYDSVYGETDGTTMWCVARNSTTYALYQSYSTDCGRTWSAMEAMA
jgi:hypothetical protein